MPYIDCTGIVTAFDSTYIWGQLRYEGKTVGPFKIETRNVTGLQYLKIGVVALIRLSMVDTAKIDKSEKNVSDDVLRARLDKISREMV